MEAVRKVVQVEESVAVDRLGENGDVAEVKHEYKWVRAMDSQMFGPFGEEELNIWYNAVYFGSMDEEVKVRKVVEGNRDWDQIIS